MADCKKARDFIEDLMSEEGLEAGQAQVDQAVKVCCDDLNSTACRDAIATLAATGTCLALTEGACPICCEKAGKYIGPVVGKGVGAAIEVIKGLLGAIGDLLGIGDKECPDYKSAADAMISEYAVAAWELAYGVSNAWTQSREQLGLPLVAPRQGTVRTPKMSDLAGLAGDGDDSDFKGLTSYPVVRREGHLWVPTYPDDPEGHKLEDSGLDPVKVFMSILLHNAAVLSRNEGRIVNGKCLTPPLGAQPPTYLPQEAHESFADPAAKPCTYVKVRCGKGHIENTLLNPTEPPVNPLQYFYFRWRDWPCGRPNAWTDAAKLMQASRWVFLQQAAQQFSQRMATAFGAEQSQKARLKLTQNLQRRAAFGAEQSQKARLKLTQNLQRRAAFRQVESKPRASRTGLYLAGAAVFAVGGLLAWRLGASKPQSAAAEVLEGGRGGWFTRG